MDTYSVLRQIADSWVLLFMFLFFVGVAIWAFLPSQASARDEARNIPFRDDTPSEPCARACSNCSCGSVADKLKGQADA